MEKQKSGAGVLNVTVPFLASNLRVLAQLPFDSPLIIQTRFIWQGTGLSREIIFSVSISLAFLHRILSKIKALPPLVTPSEVRPVDVEPG